MPKVKYKPIIKCCVLVQGYPRGPLGLHNCSRSATVQDKGKWYCTQHNPKAAQARLDKASARYEAENKSLLQLHTKAQFCLPLLAVLRDIVDLCLCTDPVEHFPKDRLKKAQRLIKQVEKELG